MSETYGSSGGSLLEEFFVKLGVRADNQTLHNFQHSISSMHHAMEALGVLAAVEMGRRLMEFVEHAVGAAAQVQEVSEVIGMSAEEIAAFNKAAIDAGVSTEDMQGALVGVTRAAGAAAAGFPRYAKLFKQLGIDTKDAATGEVKTTEQLLSTLGEKFKNWDPGMRLAVAGRLGISAKLANKLAEGGGEEFFSSMEQYRSKGLLKNSDFELAHKTEISFNRLKAVISSVVTVIGIELAPTIERVTEAFQEWWSVNRDSVVTKFSDWLWVAIYYIGLMYDGVKSVIGGFKDLWRKVGFGLTPLQAIETIVTAIVALKLALWIEGVIVALAPLLPLLGTVALVAAGLLGIVSIATQLQDAWNPISQWFGEIWKSIGDSIDSVVAKIARVPGMSYVLDTLTGARYGTTKQALDVYDREQNDKKAQEEQKAAGGNPLDRFSFREGADGRMVGETKPSAYAVNTNVRVDKMEIHADKGREATVGDQFSHQVNRAARARNAQSPFKS